MSLDIDLTRKYQISYDNGVTVGEKEECVYDCNITHNLTEMADEAGVYYACWRPEELGITKAKDLIPLLEKGYSDMKDRPEYFKQFNAVNGWGTYKHFLPFIKNYLDACIEYPESEICVSR